MYTQVGTHMNIWCVKWDPDYFIWRKQIYWHIWAYQWKEQSYFTYGEAEIRNKRRVTCHTGLYFMNYTFQSFQFNATIDSLHTFMQTLGLTKCLFWRELCWEVTSVIEWFPFDSFIDTLTSDTMYRSNLKYWFSICIAYRYAALETMSFPIPLANLVMLISETVL